MKPSLETRFDELKRYVGFGTKEAELLARFSGGAIPHFERIARDFYEKIREHEDAHAVFESEAQIERLKRSLVLWMTRLVGGTYDEDYYAQTQRIGEVHVRVGLPPFYMFTAMALIRSDLSKIADDTMGANAPAVRDALSRLLDMDLATMIESYMNALRARVERVRESSLEGVDEAMRWRALGADLAPTLIIGVKETGAIALFNHAAEEATGYAADEAVGRDFLTLCVASGDGPRVAQQVARGRATSVEATLATRANHLRTIEWRIAPVSKKNDFVVTGRDVTEERARAEHSRRTEKLAAVGTLAAGLAHEIRNPLNGALLHVSYLNRALSKMHAKPDVIDALNVVASEINRLANLVTEFLDFARPKPLELERVSAKALAARAIALAEAEGVRIALDAPAKDIDIVADGAKLEQVLLNLITNAVAVTRPNGEVIVRVRRLPRAVTFEIEDSGPGIDPKAPIFDAFYTTKPEGTGLGLAIAHRIVSDHSGALAYVRRGDKTVFTVRLPIEAREDEDAT